MPFTPIFPGPIEGWTVNYSRRHFWRVERSMEFEDVMQEAYIVFLRCASKYPDVETPQHFMALYKMAWANELIELAKEDTKLRAMVSSTPITPEGEEHQLEPVGELYHDGHLSLLLSQAPKEVLMVLNLFLSAPLEITELALAGWGGRDKRTKTGGSSRICKMLGLPPDLDVLTLVEDYFRPS